MSEGSYHFQGTKRAEGTEDQDEWSPPSYAVEGVAALARHLREKREWSEERMLRVLNRRYDHDWSRTETFSNLAQVEAAGPTDMWALTLYFATCLDIAPSQLHDFLSDVVQAAISQEEEDPDEAPMSSLSWEDLQEVAHELHLSDLTALGCEVLLHVLMERSRQLQLLQP